MQYERYDLDDPDRWVLYMSPGDETVQRLVVFVHGFGGKAVDTWLNFPVVDLARPENCWWRQSDLLFVGYKSTRDSITAVANRIRAQLPRFYPQPFHSALVIDGEPLRNDVTTQYAELILVGHSLGGVVLRRALCDAAQGWIEDGRPAERHILLAGKTRMFSPASAGFRAAGWLGIMHATSFWHAIESFLRRSSAYTDLQPDSKVLGQIQDQTVRIVSAATECEISALRAQIVWANPDDVVVDLRYETDYWMHRGTDSVIHPFANRARKASCRGGSSKLARDDDEHRWAAALSHRSTDGAPRAAHDHQRTQAKDLVLGSCRQPSAIRG